MACSAAEPSFGADLPLVRSWFDFRWRTAYARPRRRNIAGVSGLAPLITPPGKHGSSRGLVRFAGSPTPPRPVPRGVSWAPR